MPFCRSEIALLLSVEILLTTDGEAIEERYASIYYDPGGQRLLQYDNRDHHPEIVTHPHPMHKGPIPVAGEKDRAWPIDIEFVSSPSVCLLCVLCPAPSITGSTHHPLCGDCLSRTGSE